MNIVRHEKVNQLPIGADIVANTLYYLNIGNNQFDFYIANEAGDALHQITPQSIDTSNVVESVQGGTGVTINNTDPSNPIINVSTPDTNTTYTFNAADVFGGDIDLVLNGSDGTQETVRIFAGNNITLNSLNGNITIDSTDTNTTYTNGTGLDLVGTEFRHTDTSTQTSTNNSLRTYIQNINLDTFGHIIGLTTGTETVVNTDTTYTAGTGLDLIGTEFKHTDTSTQTSSINQGRTYIQTIELDDYGHVTNLTTGTETIIDGSGGGDTNDYVTGATFNTSTGDLTLTRLSGSTVVENLDGRYAIGSGTAQTLTWDGLTGQIAISDGNSIDIDGRYLQSIPLTYLESGDNISELINDVGYVTTDTNTTYTAGLGLDLIGTEFKHSDTSTQTSTSNPDGTYIQNIALDEYGHITAITTNTETGTLYTAGAGLDLVGTEFKHTDTSTQASTTNTGRSYIQNISVDDYGHITGVTTSSETVINTDDYVTTSVFDIATGDLTLTRLDGGTIVQNLDGRYLTSETDSQTLTFDSLTGNLTISNGNIVDLDGRYSLLGHSHVIADITDFPTNVSYFNNDAGYVTNNTTYSTSVVDSVGNALIRLTSSDATTDDISLVGGTNTSLGIVGDTITINSEDTTYTAGLGLDLVGTEFSHSDTSTQTSTSNAGRTYIQNINVDDYGHITSISTGTETVVNSNTTYSTSVVDSTGDAIVRLTGSDTSTDDVTLVGGTNTTLGIVGDVITINSEDTLYTAGLGLDLVGTEFSHSDTSTQTSSINTNTTYIQTIELDDYGHITNLITGNVGTDLAIEDNTVTGIIDLDIASFDSAKLVLTGNVNLSAINTPPAGESKTVTLVVTSSTNSETLTLPTSWNLYGNYDVDTRNKLTIEFANYPTSGLEVDCFINQPNV